MTNNPVRDDELVTQCERCGTNIAPRMDTHCDACVVIVLQQTVTDLQTKLERYETALRPLVEAAYGLSFGKDWNNGTQAKTQGYRQKLLDALPEARKALGDSH